MSKRKRKRQGRGRLTEAQKRAAQLMFDAYPIGKIAEEIGVHRATIWRWRRLPAFQRELDRILNRFLKDKRAETMRRIREERIAYHKTPEYKAKQRRAYEARRKLKKLSEQLDNAKSYAQHQKLWKEYEKTYNIAYFDGKNPIEFLDMLTNQSTKQNGPKKDRKEPKYIIEIV